MNLDVTIIIVDKVEMGRPLWCFGGPPAHDTLMNRRHVDEKVWRRRSSNTFFVPYLPPSTVKQGPGRIASAHTP